MTDNKTNAPFTPSWMTDQRSRRQNRRGYGRRASGAAGIRSTATKVGRRRDAALFGADTDLDDGEGSGGVLDRSANARLEGRRRPLPRAAGAPTADLGELDQSAHARLENGPDPAPATNEGLDLIDEFEQMSKPKKKRPNLPRPPRAAASRSKNAIAGKKNQFSRTKLESNSFMPESDTVDTVENSSSSHSSDIGTPGDGSQDNPILFLGEDGVGSREGGDAKRSKVAYGRSSSATAAATASKSSSLFEENVHPNDTAATDTNSLSARVGTRRSSRLVKNKMARRASLNNNDKAKNDNGKTTFVTTRSRDRTKSKKRSATPSASDAQVKQSPPNLRSTSTTSLSAGSFSSSNSSIRNSANGSCGSESFSSLARQCSDKSWASSKASSNKGTVGIKGYPQEQGYDKSWASSGKESSGKGTVAKKGFQHRRSVSVMSSFAKTGNNSTSGSAGHPQHKRSVSVASSFSRNENNGTSLKTPSSSSTMRGDLSLVRNNNILLGTPSFLSPEGGGTSFSTPSVCSTSSRKRSCMDFTSSPSNEDCEDLGGSERVSRSRKDPPPKFLMDHAISEMAPPTSLKRMSSEPVIVGLTTTTSIFSPPHKSSFANVLTSKVCLVGSDEEIPSDRKDNAIDRLSSNDESMMSTESDDDDGSSNSEEEDEDDTEEDEAPRQMTDVEVFEIKSSYDDFKFLTKSLQTWAKGSHGASMGLNNGCLIAVPSKWTFEHRANFAKWAVTAFGFRAGSVGGAGCGTFLRCGDAEGRQVLGRMRRILNDYKAGRLVLREGGGTKGVVAGKKSVEKLCKRPEKPKAKSKLTIKLSSTQRSSSLSKKGPPTLPMSPICDEFVGDLLADRMRGVMLDQKEQRHTPTLDGMKSIRSNTPGSNSSVPHFIRSMTLQPFANKIRNTTLPCFRNSPPTVDSNGRSSRSNGGGDSSRLPRLSAESAIHGSDLLNQLHGGCSDSPSPLPNCFPSRLRARLQPAAARTSLDKTFRSSFERPTGGGSLRPFESPHPRASLGLETPSSRLEFGLETPMPKQAEHWGSRPVFGRDWGESVCCCDGTIDTCSQIFAKSWFTSEFYGNKDLSSQYRMALDEEDESSLFAFYEADANLGGDDDDDDDDEDVDSEVASITRESLDVFPTTELMSKKIGFARCDSVGASALDLLNLDDKVKDFGLQSSPSHDRRRTMKLRKYARMSLCVAAASDFLQQPKLKRCHRMSEPPTTRRPFMKGTPVNTIVGSAAFSCVLSFLNEGELIHTASLVCTAWADAAAEALGNLMLVSVGCDPQLNDKANNDDCSRDEYDETDSVAVVSPAYSSVAKSMERDWPFLMNRFPWARFLSDGSFKRVYKVWNDSCGGYEALSVMDVDAINDLGNSNLVGTELAVSVLLSSLARRNICPNFVVTRGVFTCQHEPPAPHWGCRDDVAPCGTTYDRHKTQPNLAPNPSQCGNYQYIRMELCQHGDVEEFIKNHPEKVLELGDCRNLLFQMAFALHVAGDRFGLKHYDVKLLNFFLQSARDPTIADEEHPHVVLRYGVGSHVFRLRMHPSSAHIAKLADYGTSVMRTDTDGQPVSLGQFTTLENTPPDFLILGNAAEQGYGHDCFNLGLCMFSLFTGHGPYEEILDEVVCPANLKGKLRKIWRQPHNVIRSVMYDNDENGAEIEDETLYDTLYRFLVLFGIPEKQFGIKKHGKVWRAINSTLLLPKRARFKKCPDTDAFEKDRKKFSLATGTDKRIVDARRRLLAMDGAMELLLSLVSFDPKTRATPLDVINSGFMRDLIEDDSTFYCKDDIVKSYMAYLTN